MGEVYPINDKKIGCPLPGLPPACGLLFMGKGPSLKKRNSWGKIRIAAEGFDPGLSPGAERA
jgi:hypothetical protein